MPSSQLLKLLQTVFGYYLYTNIISRIYKFKTESIFAKWQAVSSINRFRYPLSRSGTQLQQDYYFGYVNKLQITIQTKNLFNDLF